MHRSARPHRRVLPPLLACLLSAGLGACSADTTDPLLEAGGALFQSFDPADGDRAFGTLNRLVAEQASLAAAIAVGQSRSENEETRYAAVYVLGLAAEDEIALDALAVALDDEVAYLRAISAGSLIGLGRLEAIPVLIELLTTTDEIPGSEPSTFVDRFASDALVAHTDQDFGSRDAASTAERLAAQQRWRAWWESVRDTLTWDAGAGKYTT